jgi:eukaryotic-like serine/threonine-protein kinase
LLAEVVARVVMRVGRLPRVPRPSGEVTHVSKRKSELRLPAWLPPNWLIGGFFVVRLIGTGDGSLMFVARRSEERHEEGAETFALKVPAYTGAAAHTFSLRIPCPDAFQRGREITRTGHPVRWFAVTNFPR